MLHPTPGFGRSGIDRGAWWALQPASFIPAVGSVWRARSGLVGIRSGLGPGAKLEEVAGLCVRVLTNEISLNINGRTMIGFCGILVCGKALLRPLHTERERCESWISDFWQDQKS